MIEKIKQTQLVIDGFGCRYINRGDGIRSDDNVIRRIVANREAGKEVGRTVRKCERGSDSERRYKIVHTVPKSTSPIPKRIGTEFTSQPAPKGPTKPYPNHYAVSNGGKVYSFSPVYGLWSEVTPFRGRYVKIAGEWRKIELLVARAYVPNPLGYEHVSHIDGDDLNNNALNLEWVSEPSTRRYHRSSESNIKCYSQSGALVAVYKNIKEACRLSRVDQSAISRVLTGKRQTAGGFIWRV